MHQQTKYHLSYLMTFYILVFYQVISLHLNLKKPGSIAYDASSGIGEKPTNESGIPEDDDGDSGEKPTDDKIPEDDEGDIGEKPTDGNIPEDDEGDSGERPDVGIPEE
ncbi:MAG: hypothetical protein JXR03_20980 [Cyclobacteriaceae bacterium]